MNDSGEVRIHPKIESLESELNRLKETLSSHSELNEEFKRSLDDIFKSLKTLNNSKAGSEEFVDSIAQLKLTIDKSKLFGITFRILWS